jgi:hypothetical protein
MGDREPQWQLERWLKELSRYINVLQHCPGCEHGKGVQWPQVRTWVIVSSTMWEHIWMNCLVVGVYINNRAQNNWGSFLRR